MSGYLDDLVQYYSISNLLAMEVPYCCTVDGFVRDHDMLAMEIPQSSNNMAMLQVDWHWTSEGHTWSYLTYWSLGDFNEILDKYSFS